MLAKYNASEKGRARQARYQRSAKGRARWLKYSRSEKGRVSEKRKLGTSRGRYFGKVETVEQADLINAHIKERLRAFTRQQARAEMEALAPDTIPL